MKCLSATISELPPSANKIYVRIGRGTILSKEAKTFKAKAKMELLQQWAFEEELDPNQPYVLSLTFYLPKLENAGWPSKAKTRFARRDVTNLIKLLEDIKVQTTGVDDSATLDVHVYKRLDPDFPRVELSLVQLKEMPT
jgi:Holliday junction resolvase RusA-like endonuclease